MGICIGLAASSLKIFPTNQTAIYVDIRQGNRANFLKVEVEDRSVDLERFGKLESYKY